MKRRIGKWAALILVVWMCICLCAQAENAISTTVVMRVSHMTQNAVVNAGEDLSVEVNIDGVTPDSYQWYFKDVPIDGANQKVLNVVDAQPEDTGLYRLDAFDADGAMVVSMDIAVRVVAKEVPKSGDGSMPVGYALAGIMLCGGALFILLRRSRMA